MVPKVGGKCSKLLSALVQFMFMESEKMKGEALLDPL